MIQTVPDMFRPRIRVEYPPDNKQIFEEWFADNVRAEDIPGDRVYLPVNWCGFQVNNDYGKGRKMANLQAFIDGLDRSEKYFTITQYDDGPLVDFKDLDIKVFGSGGGRIDCPIPLVCQPHPFTFQSKKPNDRQYLASFVGSVSHPIRQEIIDSISSLPEEKKNQYYIRTDRHSIQEYCEIMSKSAFALCPRGYGLTSFRIAEALQFGTIPVYISDQFITPFPGAYTKTAILHLNSEDISDIDEYLRDGDYLHSIFQKNGNALYDQQYTYEGAKKLILEWLKRL